MKKTITPATEKAKIALMQVGAGAALTALSLFFKSIWVFVISLVILGLGINGCIKLIKGETE